MHVNYIVAHASPIVRILEEKGVSNLLIEVESTKLRKKAIMLHVTLKACPWFLLMAGWANG